MNEQGQVLTEPRAQPTPKIKSKQIGGLPYRQIVALQLLQTGDNARWLMTVPANSDWQPGLVAGIEVLGNSVLPFVPAPLPRMKIGRLFVVVEAASVHNDAEYGLKLLYRDAQDKFNELVTTPLLADRNRFAFNIPLEHLEREGMFICGLTVTLMDTEKPVVLRGIWLEIEGA